MSGRDQREAEQRRYLQGIDAVKQRLLALPNVVQVGVALRETGGELTDEVVIRVSVTQKLPPDALTPDEMVPPVIDGLRTDVIVHRRMIPIIGFNDEDDWKNYSPKVGGIRIGNDEDSGTGTLGCFAKAADGSTVFLSNHHVLFSGGAKVGAKVGQPEYSGSCCCSCNKIGTVLDGDQTLDCAIGKLDSDEKFIPKVRRIMRPDNTVELSGLIAGSSAPVLNEEVWKVGARTGLTRATLSALTPDVELTAKAPFPKAADHGDSGSVVVELSTGNVVALLKAIDHATGTKGYATDITSVLSRLNITILATDPTQQYNVAMVAETPVERLARLGTDSGFDALVERIRAAPAGERLLAALETHQGECLKLVNTCRQVTIAWHRNQGPTFLAALARSARVPEYRMPGQVDAITRARAVQAMRDAFERFGSPELARYVREDPDGIAALLTTCDSVEEMIGRLECATAPVPTALSAEPR